MLPIQNNKQIELMHAICPYCKITISQICQLIFYTACGDQISKQISEHFCYSFFFVKQGHELKKNGLFLFRKLILKFWRSKQKLLPKNFFYTIEDIDPLSSNVEK